MRISFPYILTHNYSKKARSKAEKEKVSFKTLEPYVIEMINEKWEDNEYTSSMWQAISGGHLREFVEILQHSPEAAHVRSSDGRGPMWWAHEYKRPKMVQVLKKLGVKETLVDANGRRPGE